MNNNEELALTQKLLDQSVFQIVHSTRLQFPASQHRGSEHEEEAVLHLLAVMQL
jgi:hypothetical protein